MTGFTTHNLPLVQTLVLPVVVVVRDAAPPGDRA